MLSVNPDSAVTTAGTPVTIDVLANDTGTGLVVTSFSNPTNGSLVYNSDKSFTYTPAAGFVGDDTFSYTVRDAQGAPATAEVTISVLAEGGATVATNDYVEVVAGGGVIVPVLANDMAAGGGDLQIIAVSAPGHGVVNVLPDQSIRYLPQRGFVGIDSFTYTVLDAQGATASATMTVKVVAVNSEPIAADDSFDVVADTTTVLAVLANDSDPNGGSLQVVGFTMPSHGRLLFDLFAKTFAYTPAAGYEGQDQFTYTIRDNRGASASASVTLTVARPVASPVAIDDQITTEAGVPVTIDVLANDNLPAGQEIAIIAVTLPFRGKLDFNPDKTLTYTPDTGFVGNDDFTYTIGNGKGGTAKATVTIDVTPAGSAAAVYANGYAHRRRIVVPASSASGGSHANFPLWVDLAGTWLKSASHGGAVASDDGHDLRFELVDGTRLDHEIDRYDPVTGALGAWVRVPVLSDSAATVVFLYYDKPGLAESEAAPTAVWQDYLAVWHLPGDNDATSAARSLTSTGTIASSADGLGAGALALDGNGMLSIADASWLDDTAALSIQLRGKADSTGHNRGLFGVGPDLFSGDGDIIIRYQSVGYGDGQPQNILHSSLSTNAGKLRASSAAATQTTSWQSIVLAWQAGDAQSSLYLDGSKVEPSFATAEGGAATRISGPLYLGASSQDSASGGWRGSIDEVRLRPSKLSDAWIAAEHINQSTPALFIGIGDAETPIDAVSSVVAVPFIVPTETGQWVDIDVLDAAVLGSGADTPTIQTVSQPGNGTISTIDGKIRYTPVATFVGRDSFTYTLAAAGKTSTARVDIVVATNPSVGGGDPGPNITYLRTVNVAANSQLTNALSNAQAGDDIVLASGNYSGPFTLEASGTATNPIRIRSATPQGADLRGKLTLNGSHAIVYQLKGTGTSAHIEVFGTDNKVLRCAFIGTAQARGAVCMFNGADRTEVGYCSVTDFNNRGFLVRGGSNMAKDCYIHHNYIKGSQSTGSAATAAILVGESQFDTFRQARAHLAYNLVEDHNTTVGCLEFKSSGNLMEFCTMRNCFSRMETRFGVGNDHIGNATINAQGVIVWGRDHRVIGHFHDGAFAGSWSDIGVGAGTGTLEQYAAGDIPAGTYPRSENCLLVGNTGPLRIGAGSSTFTTPAIGTRIEAHTGAIAYGPGAQSGTTGGAGAAASVPVPAYVILNPADVGPDAGLAQTD